MPKPKHVDLVIIGAGTAGLTAAKEAEKITSNIILIDRGPLGTTCSRVGCMPSKILLQIAHDYRRVKSLAASGIWRDGDKGRLDRRHLMLKLREKRDHFVKYALEDTLAFGDRFIQGEAQFIGPSQIRIDGKLEITAQKIIIATGSSPVVPKEWQSYKSRIVTTDDLFEMEDLPEKWGVIGLGPLGLEIGQALAWLDCDVSGFDKREQLGGIRDTAVQTKALEGLRRDFPIMLGVDVSIEKDHGGNNKALCLKYGSQVQKVDRVLAALGRKANLEHLNLEAAGLMLDAKGKLSCDPSTMAIKDTQVYLAGDVDAERAVLHEGADDGRIAGYNSVRPGDTSFQRRVSLRICFTTPNIGSVGQSLNELSAPVVGEAKFDNQGRSYIMEENFGLLRIYAQQTTGLILGAEFIMPSGEHIGHILAAAIEQKATVHELLRVPFYHPTIEEGLRTALRDLKKKLKPTGTSTLDLAIKA
ncbi:MAG: dihydrolipoyl dehydrogenase [Chitinophagaceae bacterium]|nr:dihydrolipoyl dehydrogenase [Oligoflexus sp.]